MVCGQPHKFFVPLVFECGDNKNRSEQHGAIDMENEGEWCGSGPPGGVNNLAA